MAMDTDTSNITDETPHTTLPSSTTAEVGSHITLFESVGEAVSSSFEISSTSFSGVPFLIDIPISEDVETIPLAPSEDNGSPPWLNGWEKPEEKTELDSVAQSFMATQSPTVNDFNSETAANTQSDSSDDSYFRVSAEVENQYLAKCECYSSLKNKDNIVSTSVH